MTAHPMQRDARGDLAVAVVKGHALAVDVTHHQRHVIGRERMPQRAVTHPPPGGVTHLAVLKMKARTGEAGEVAGVIVVQMNNDHVPDKARIPSEWSE